MPMEEALVSTCSWLYTVSWVREHLKRNEQVNIYSPNSWFMNATVMVRQVVHKTFPSSKTYNTVSTQILLRMINWKMYFGI